MSLSFSDRLEKALGDSPLKQREIAELAGITPPYLSDLKKGKKTNPSRDLIEKLAKLLKVSPSWLMLGVEVNNPTANENSEESSTSPNILREDSNLYRTNVWKSHFEALIETADFHWLMDRVEEFQAQAFAGDLAAKALLAEIIPRVRKRFNQLNSKQPKPNDQ